MKHLLLLLTLLGAAQASATHNHAGEILVEQIGELTIRATVITYTPDGISPADRNSLTVNWGDGMSQAVNRDGTGAKLADSNFKKNVYETTHTFSKLGKYTIYMTDPNRNGGILNLNFPMPDVVTFHIQTTINLVPVQANGKYNKTPELRNAPITVATIGYPFRHFPNAIDADGDSLAFRLVSPMEDLNKSISNYQLPSLIVPSDSNKISFNEKNGTFDWNSPRRAGLYTIAIQVISYRGGVAIDTLLRDMNIIVQGPLASLQSVESQGFAKISPNPIHTEGVLDIDEKFGQNVELRIVNSIGQIMETAYLKNEKYYQIKRRNWASGLYFISLKSEKFRTILKVEIF
jgi:hypothetical protein